MKKFIFAVALGGMFFLSSCGGDDDGCQTCTSTVGSETKEVCKGENGNAVEDGTDTGVAFDTYISTLETSILGVSVWDCK